MPHLSIAKAGGRSDISQGRCWNGLATGVFWIADMFERHWQPTQSTDWSIDVPPSNLLIFGNYFLWAGCVFASVDFRCQHGLDWVWIKLNPLVQKLTHSFSRCCRERTPYCRRVVNMQNTGNYVWFELFSSFRSTHWPMCFWCLITWITKPNMYEVFDPCSLLYRLVLETIYGYHTDTPNIS